MMAGPISLDKLTGQVLNQSSMSRARLSLDSVLFYCLMLGPFTETNLPAGDMDKSLRLSCKLGLGFSHAYSSSMADP